MGEQTEMAVLEAIDLFKESLVKAGKHPRTLYTYGKDLEQIMAFFGEATPVSAITLPRIGRFLKSDQLLLLPNGNERAQQTVRKTIRVFRMWMVWLHQEGHLEAIRLPKSIPMGKSSAASA
jgi:site-specific recombinase XerD